MTVKKKVFSIVFLLIIILSFIQFFYPACLSFNRAGHLQCTIDRHVGFAHFTRGMNVETIEALYKEVSPEDIPHLLELLRSSDHVTQMTSAKVLARLGESGREALEAELKAEKNSDSKIQFYKEEAILDALKEVSKL